MALQHENAVDLVKLARETTQRDIARVHPDACKVIAPAKINLVLAVGSRQDDGYHPVSNILHTVMLHDTVYVRIVEGEEADVLREAAQQGQAQTQAQGQGQAQGQAQAQTQAKAGSATYATNGAVTAHVECRDTTDTQAPVVAAADNLAFKAACAFAKECGKTDVVLDIRLEKHVPAQAGLGGGSSDAAAVIAVLADAWGFESTSPEAQRAAIAIGSDIAFFLQGGCALYVGRGEQPAATLATRSESVVLIKPSAGLSTKLVYDAFDTITGEGSAWLQRDRLAGAVDAAKLPLANDLTDAALSQLDDLAAIHRWASNQDGAIGVVLCGSGSATAVICKDFSAACTIAARAKQCGWWARTTALCASRASVVSGR